MPVTFSQSLVNGSAKFHFDLHTSLTLSVHTSTDVHESHGLLYVQNLDPAIPGMVVWLAFDFAECVRLGRLQPTSKHMIAQGDSLKPNPPKLFELFNSGKYGTVAVLNAENQCSVIRNKIAYRITELLVEKRLSVASVDEPSHKKIRVTEKTNTAPDQATPHSKLPPGRGGKF